MGRGVTTPCSDSAIAAASAAPIQIGQVPLPFSLAQEHDRLIGR